MRLSGRDIANYCEKILNSNGLYMKDMCKAIGMKQAVVSMWKSHPELIPKLESVVKIAEFIKLSIDELLDYKVVKTTSQKEHEIEQVLSMLRCLKETDVHLMYLNVKNLYDLNFEKEK